MTTMHIKHGAVVSTRIQTYKMPAPRKKPTEEDVRQAKDELVKMRDSIRDSIAFAQATGKPIPEAYKEEQ